MKRQSAFRFFAFLSILVSYEVAATIPEYRVSIETESLELSRSVCYWQEDQNSSGKTDNSEIISALKLPLEKFICQEFDYPSLGYTDKPVWIVMKLLTAAEVHEEYILTIGYSMLDDVRYALLSDNRQLAAGISGDHLKFTERPLLHRNPGFRLKLKNNTQYLLALRIQTGSSLQFPMSLQSESNFLNTDRTIQYIHGIFFGVMFALIAYNLFLFLSIREKNYLYYVAFMISHLICQLSFNGFAFEYFWPESVIWNDRAPRIFVGAFSLFALIFVRGFLRLPAKARWTKMLTNISIGLVLLQIPVSSFTTGKISAEITSFASLSAMVTIIALTFYALVRGDRSAKFLMISWVSFLASGFLFSLKTHGFIAGNLIIDNGMLFGSVIEAVLLSFALAYRINLLKEEKAESQRELLEHLQEMDRYKDSVNASLERTVKERTSTIEKQNAELNEQIKMAEGIQRSLLPRPLDDARLQTGFLYIPTMAIGGDYLDYRMLDADHLGMFVCDVSGHGVAAALLASMVKFSLADWPRYASDPAALLHKIHHDIQDKLNGNFITAITCTLNLRTGIGRLASAGHMPAIIRNENGQIREINAPGTMIFDMAEPKCGYTDFLLNKNEALFFYTDGIVEARNEHGQFYGEERFFDLLARNQTMPPAAICDLLGTELKMFVKEVPEGVQDDVSLLGVSMLLSDIEKDYVSALRDIPASQVLSHE
ncbi:MAG: SpoIIE family protein phosphatase [Leptospiraceae bacterium]|nr:SpoIIE family protein phosphatase [Leptospiraceae bacterium]